MQPDPNVKKIGLWKKTFKDSKTGQDKAIYVGSEGDLQYIVGANDYKTESKHPDLRLTIKPKEIREVPTSTVLQAIRQPNAQRPETEDDLPF